MDPGIVSEDKSPTFKSPYTYKVELSLGGCAFIPTLPVPPSKYRWTSLVFDLNFKSWDTWSLKSKVVSAVVFVILKSYAFEVSWSIRCGSVTLLISTLPPK